MLWWALAGCGAEQAVLSSPLMGASPVEDGGVGRVIEVLPAGSYTYLRVQDRPESWLVVSGAPRAVGETVSWRGYAEVHRFSSRRLSRTFDHLLFASIDAVEGE